MKPDIFSFGPLELPAYFTFLVIGFAMAVFWATRFAKKEGLDAGAMIDFGILMFVFGAIGAKVLHVLADGYFYDYVNICIAPEKVVWEVDRRECLALGGKWNELKAICNPAVKNCTAWLTGSGFAFYGGLLLSSFFAVFYINKKKWPTAKICDMGGWTVMLGLFWGRLGCFFAGCCFGKITHTFIGLIFPPGSSASRYHWKQGYIDTYRVDSLPVHPTQLYEAIASLLISMLAYFVINPRKKFDGQVFIFSMSAYAVFRFFVEFLRSDERGGIWFLSTSQIIAILVLIVCVFLNFKFQKTEKNKARKKNDSKKQGFKKRLF